MQRLTEAAEKAKIELSNATQSEINLPFITATPEGPKHLDLTLTRVKFEELASALIDRCRVPVEQALKEGCEAKIKKVTDLNSIDFGSVETTERTLKTIDEWEIDDLSWN